MRNPSSLRRVLAPSYGAFIVGLFAACSSDSPPDPAPGTGGNGGTGTGGQATGGTATGGTGGSVGGTGGTGGSVGGTGGATGGSSGSGGTGGQETGGTGGVLGGAGNVASGGAGTGANGGTATGGAAGDASGGTAGIVAGSGGTAGGTGGTAGAGGKANVWQCPAGVTGMPTLGTLTRVAGVPPADSFNMMNGTFGNIEGPVWVEDALYVSEMTVMPYDQNAGNSEVKMSRILKVTSGGQVSIEVADSGSNGLAIDGPGSLLAAVHKDGSIKRLALPGGAATPIASTFMNARFNSPNDLTVHTATGTLYFTDPIFNGPMPAPQTMMRAYRLAPGGMPEPIPSAASPDQLDGPNGITLSLAEDFLYVAAGNGRRYPVMPDGTLGAGTDFPATSQSDGMVIDCAGNLYVTKANQPSVVVYTPEGTMIGTITVPEVQAATNVAFGGADHRTLYVTGMGNMKGLFQMTLNLPGRPY
jgi:gluconolactonase